MSLTQTLFSHPTTILVSGPTGCGKTRFVCKVLHDRLISPFPERIIWVYAEWQNEYDRLKEEFPNIEFKDKYTDELYQTLSPKETNLLVLDDQMSETSDSKSLVQLFTKGSHHRNLSIIYLVQNLFFQGKSSRTISLNSHYIVVFRNMRDVTQFRTLANQIMPHNSGWLMQAYLDATSVPFGYIVIDNHPRSDPAYRFRTRIFHDEQPLFYNDRKLYIEYKRENQVATENK